jgi:hypothetical protein
LVIDEKKFTPEQGAAHHPFDGDVTWKNGQVEIGARLVPVWKALVGVDFEPPEVLG